MPPTPTCECRDNPTTCAVCGHAAGCMPSHFPFEEPLGPLDRCALCGRVVCPVCADRGACCEVKR